MMPLIAGCVLAWSTLGIMLLDRYNKWWTKRWQEELDGP